MPTLSRQQTQSAIAELDQAVDCHQQWHNNLLRALITNAPPDPQDLTPDAHRRCHFGQWYESTTTFLRDHPAFVSVGEAHKKMHDAARSLLKLAAEGSAIPENTLGNFEQTLDSMRLEIQALRHELMEKIQNQDPLTGALNRAGLMPWLREQLALHERAGQGCALIMLDLDHFKRINDQYGHRAGDKVLVSTVECLQQILRRYDRVYRYGGEEFLLCMPSTTIEEARVIADRLCRAVSAQRIPLGSDGDTLQITASLGIAMLDPSRSVEDAIDAADQAMYAAKKAGRNCVVTEAQTPP